jgi:uncharacterized protein YegJ (DUF2314 family)
MSRDSHRGAADPIRVAVPASIDRVLAVFASRAEPPFEPLVLAWLDRHAAGPLRGKVKRWVEEGRLSISAHDPSGISVPILGACFAKRIDPSTIKRFQAARSCILLRTREPLANPPVGLWAAFAAGRALAAAFAGVVWDQGLNTFWRPGLEESDLPAGGAVAVAEHVLVLNSVDERGLAWFTTLGLRQFGLPNLEVRDAPPNLGGRLVHLVLGAAQVLVESALAGARCYPGTSFEILLGPEIRVSSADVGRAERSGEEGHAGKAGIARLEYTGDGRRVREPFITLRPPIGFERNAGVWLNEVLDAIAPRDSSILCHEAADQGLETAHRRAVAALGQAKDRFQRGLPVGSELLIKKGFAFEHGGIEYMWIAVTTWKGSRIQGHLSSEPHFCRDLRAGDPVELSEAEVYDWMIEHPDGKRDGGFTQQVLERGV